jgi:hypothetical protein
MRSAFQIIQPQAFSKKWGNGDNMGEKKNLRKRSINENKMQIEPHHEGRGLTEQKAHTIQQELTVALPPPPASSSF